jgi:hypothetical protein
MNHMTKGHFRVHSCSEKLGLLAPATKQQSGTTALSRVTLRRVCNCGPTKLLQTHVVSITNIMEFPGG